MLLIVALSILGKRLKDSTDALEIDLFPHPAQNNYAESEQHVDGKL